MLIVHEFSQSFGRQFRAEILQAPMFAALAKAVSQLELA